MDKIVAAKTLTGRVAARMSLSLAEKEKLEAYEKQDKLNVKEAKLKADFMALDADGDGTISTEELGKILRAMRTKLRMSESEIKRTLREFDMDGDGEIEVSEFLYMMSSSKKKDLIHRAIVQHSAIHQEFKEYDADGSGDIDREEFLKVYTSRCGVQPSEEQLDSLLKSVNVKENGRIGYDQFLRLLLNTNYKPVV